MNIRWERVCLLASLLTLSLMTARPAGDRLLHEQRVANSDGTWCFLLNADGTMEQRYGVENCMGQD